MAAFDRGTPQTRKHWDELARLKRGENQACSAGPITGLRFKDLPKNNCGAVTLRRLVKTGAIDEDMGHAIKEIGRVCAGMEDAYRIRPSVQDRVDCGNEQDTFPRWLQTSEWRIFARWKTELDKMHPAACQIFLNIAIFGATFKYIDRKFHKDDGFARDVLVAGLKLWVSLERHLE